MANAHLYIAIGIPILVNTTLLGLLWAHMNSRFDGVNQRFDDMRDLWRSELHRVEEVLDARLKHIENERRH
jgi:hypothetical protein